MCAHVHERNSIAVMRSTTQALERVTETLSKEGKSFCALVPLFFCETELLLALDVLFVWILCMVDATVALRDRSLTVALPSLFRSVYKCRVHLVRIGWLGK